MKDRLTELLGVFPTWHKTLKDQWFPQAVERLADHLIANGVIVPCVNIGQIVYRIYWDFRVDACKVSALTQKSDKTWKIRITSGIGRNVFEVTPDELGKTVFLTKEEAEKALAGRSKE